MTEFEKIYQNYNPRQAALDEARALLTAAAKAAMADGTLPEAELPAFIVEIPADVKNGDIASNLAMAGARTWRKAPKMIADALLAQLPLTVEVEDYSTNEKIFYPPQALDTADAPPAEGGTGTLAYYAPWGDVVMFYGDYNASSSLYELGQAVSGGDLVGSLSGAITLTAVS